jgi:hypothetical protein
MTARQLVTKSAESAGLTDTEPIGKGLSKAKRNDECRFLLKVLSLQIRREQKVPKLSLVS